MLQQQSCSFQSVSVVSKNKKCVCMDMDMYICTHYTHITKGICKGVCVCVCVCLCVCVCVCVCKKQKMEHYRFCLKT